jgi:hypothetical protein
MARLSIALVQASILRGRLAGKRRVGVQPMLLRELKHARY